MTHDNAFDEYAEDYDATLAHGLSVSGEDRDYFAQGRIAWLARSLGNEQRPASIMDFGCGTGSAFPYFFDLLEAQSVIGIDVSARSLDVARQSQIGCESRFFLMDEYVPEGAIDLAFCNGVFHHIPVNERGGVIDYIYRSLKPGGWFAMWENNPWNPGTRYVMSRLPFDRDAVTLTPNVARRLVRAGKFEVERTDFLFIFPRVLRWLRGIESHISHWPIGAQYQILCRKPRG
jgi:SAM-dependent methyltransferase